jgi:hypothetical protein
MRDRMYMTDVPCGQMYEAPKVEMLEVNVEKGFTATETDINTMEEGDSPTFG